MTIGSFDGKGQFNVIKDTVEIEGDVRALTDATRDTIKYELERIVQGIATSFDVQYDFEFQQIIPRYTMILSLHLILLKH